MRPRSRMTAASGRELELTAGHLRVTVVEVGGGVRAFMAAGASVLDGYEADEIATFANAKRSFRGRIA